jgi:hypothetical protein
MFDRERIEVNRASLAYACGRGSRRRWVRIKIKIRIRIMREMKV